MPAQRPRASFEPISPAFDLKALVETTPNFSYVDRISCDMIDQQGALAFEKLVLSYVIVGGKPLVIDGYEDRLDPWTFTPKWLRDNCGDKIENARNLTSKEDLALTMGHYLKNMGLLTNQFFDKPDAYKQKGRQRVYLKDIDCPAVWWDKLKEQIPGSVSYLNESTGEIGGPGSVPDPHSNVPGRRLGRGIARAGDLMSSLPADMRAENLMCYVGHEGTYTPAHREMCASLGQNIMVEASSTVSDDGKAEKPGSSIWFMTESKDRHLVAEYWLSVLGHDIEVENHFAQVIAWKKAPFTVYVVEQRPGDFILIPPLAPHQVWNRGTRTMKVAWNRTTVETLEMALNEALPRSRIVCRDEQYKNKAMIYYTLQKYASLLTMALQQAARMPGNAGQQMMYSAKIKQLRKDFRRLFALYRQTMLGEMFNPDDRDTPKSLEYIPFDSNVTCAYCRGNIFNRFLTCPSCKDLLGHNVNDGDGDPYDVCMDCYVMGRSCACLSGQKWVEQFRWKELTSKYETWRKLIIALDGGQVNEKTPLPLVDERKRLGNKTLAEVCKDQLKRRPWKDVRKPVEPPKDDEESDEEIIVSDDGTVKKTTKKKSKTWLKNNHPCHVCCHRHSNWKMANCTTCDRWWCYGTLFRGWDKMPIEIMENADWSCPHCLGICFAGACKREGKMKPYEPKGTLLGHDTKKVADARSVEALVDFSVSNLNWLKDDDLPNRVESGRFKRAQAEAQKNKEVDPALETDDEADDKIDESQVQMEYTPTDATPIDPALQGDQSLSNGSATQDTDFYMSGALPNAEEDEDEVFARRLQLANSSLPPPAQMVTDAPGHGARDGYTPVRAAGYIAPAAEMYPQPNESSSYIYPSCDRGPETNEDGTGEELRPFRKRPAARSPGEGEEPEEIAMHKAPRAKKPRLAAAGFRSSDLAEEPTGPLASKAKNEAQRQFEKEKERKALDKAKVEGRFIMLQAALKGKKRIVNLKVPGARLAQMLAQQTAKAALTASSREDVNGEHDAVSRAASPEQNAAEEASEILLKSDIAPKKTKDDWREYRKQKERSGIVVTGATKKALVPVEKDENYVYRYRKRMPNGKRVEQPMAAHHPTNASEKPIRGAARRPRKSAFDYEEVDIGSGDEEITNGFVPINSTTTDSKTEKRSLPGYLQSRQEMDPDLPDELDEDLRDRRVHRKQLSASNAAASAQLEAEAVAALRPKHPTAGKRPSMRPAAPIITGDVDPDADDAANAGDAIDRAASGEPEHTATPTTPPTVHRDGLTHAARLERSRSVTLSQQSQGRAAMNEQNRLAKLESLKMVDASPTQRSSPQQLKPAQKVSLVDAIDLSDKDNSDDDDDDDDSVEAVPAKRGRGPIRA